MDDVKEMLVADSIYGDVNGICVLEGRTRRGEIPGFTIPVELMEDVTCRARDQWHKEWEQSRGNRPYNDASSPSRQVRAVDELATLAPVLFRYEYATRSENLTVGRSTVHERDLHADGGILRPSELLLHVQGKVLGAVTRDVYLATVNFGGLLTSEDPPGTDIIQHVRGNVRLWNRKVASDQCEIHVGKTQEGQGTVLSNIPEHQTAHLFTGNGGWTRFREIPDCFPLR